MSSEKKGIFTQCMKMIGAHAFASAIIAVFMFVAFWWFAVQNVWKYILAGAFVLAYFGIIYSAARKQQDMDSRSYTGTSVNPKKGLLFGAAICASMLAVYGLYKMSWTLMSVDGTIAAVSGNIYNFLFCFWNMPVFGVLNVNGGNAQWGIMLIMYIAAFAASVCGYTAGCRNYNLSEKLDSAMYENTDK